MPMGIGLGIGVTRGGGVGWWPAGSELALEFDNQRGFNSIDRTKTTPNSILTYTNPSAKLVYGSDGVLRYAPHNLLLQSQTLNSGTWVKTNVSVVNTADVVAPDGTLTADKIENTINAPTSGAQLIQTLTTLGTGTYAYSVYAKIGSGAADSNRFVVRNNTTAVNAVSLIIDWSTGAITQITGSGATATSAGDGWWRIVMPFSLTATVGDSIRFFVGVTGQVESVGEFIYAWGAQLQRTPNHSNAYIPTTTDAVYSLPIDHNPTTFAPLGVLIEEQRTNLLTYSEQFDNAAWTNTLAGTGTIPTKTANAGVAPDGTTTADRLVLQLNGGTTTSDAARLRQSATTTAAAHTLSVWLKSYDGVSTYSMGIQLSSTATAITVTGEWQRFTLTVTTTAASQANDIFIRGGQTPTHSDAADILVWGAQLEAGAFATSYIPTVASQVTRAADQVSILTSAFAYNAAAGTMVAEVRAANLSVSRRIAVLYNDASNRIALNLDNGSQLFVRTLGSTVASVDGGTFTVGQSDKVAVAFTTDDYVATVNGAAVGVDPDGGAMPSGITVLQVGNQAGIEQTNGHIKRLTYFPTRRSNADLQVLTT